MTMDLSKNIILKTWSKKKTLVTRLVCIHIFPHSSHRRGPMSHDIPVAVSSLVPRFWFLNTVLQRKGPGRFGNGSFQYWVSGNER